MLENDGRSFERLVESLEQHLAADGEFRPRIVLDAHIPDSDTGEPRQIDVALYYPAHHGEELLFIVECKDRGRHMTVEGIEQLIAKRDAVRAARLIIVTRAGFSDAARTKAEKNGVVLLTVQAKGEAAWPDWVRGNKLWMRRSNFLLLETLPKVFGDRVAFTRAFTAQEPIIRCRGAEPISFERLLGILLEEYNFAATAPEERTEFNIPVELERGMFKLVPDVAPGENEVHAVAYRFDHWITEEEVPFSVLSYDDVTRGPRIVVVSTPEFELNGEPHRMVMARRKATDGSFGLECVVSKSR